MSSKLISIAALAFLVVGCGSDSNDSDIATDKETLTEAPPAEAPPTESEPLQYDALDACKKILLSLCDRFTECGLPLYETETEIFCIDDCGGFVQSMADSCNTSGTYDRTKVQDCVDSIEQSACFEVCSSEESLPSECEEFQIFETTPTVPSDAVQPLGCYDDCRL